MKGTAELPESKLQPALPSTRMIEKKLDRTFLRAHDLRSLEGFPRHQVPQETIPLGAAKTGEELRGVEVLLGVVHLLPLSLEAENLLGDEPLHAPLKLQEDPARPVLDRGLAPPLNVG